MRTLSSDDAARLEASARLRLGVAATVLGLAAMLVGFALLVPDDREPAIRVLGAILLIGGVVGLVRTLAWARRWRWSYDQPSRGLSAGETFVIAAVVVIVGGGLYPLVGPWFLLGFLAIPAAAVLKQTRRRP